MVNKHIRPEQEQVRAAGMHVEGDAHRPIDDSESVFDEQDIELNPTAFDNEIVPDAEFPIEEPEEDKYDTEIKEP